MTEGRCLVEADFALEFRCKQLKLTVAEELENTSKLGVDTIKLDERVKVRCFATGGMSDYRKIKKDLNRSE